MSDEFYIGYEGEAPARIARRVRLASATLLSIAVVLPALVIATQSRFSTGVFEFGRTRTVVGRIVEFPYPAIDIVGPPSSASPDFYWLVGPGKHGAAAAVLGLNGRVARVRGTLIERDGESMLQIEPGAIAIADGESTPAALLPEPAASVRLAGEIVDSKCHLGVMKPGEGPTHRDCAVRCLLGGVPPMVVVHGAGAVSRLALVDESGRPFAQDVTAIAGRPLAIRGTLLRQGARRFLSARISDIEVMR